MHKHEHKTKKWWECKISNVKGRWWRKCININTKVNNDENVKTEMQKANGDENA